MQPFDPSKMDPKVLMELSQLVQQLPPEKLREMQTLMHNMMAGIDVSREMAEFERSLPPNFRERMVSIMGTSGVNPFGGGGTGHVPQTPSMAIGASKPTIEVAPSSAELTLREARVTLLRAVAAGDMAPEDAEKLLFPEG